MYCFQSPEREGCEQKRAKTEAALAQDVIAWGEATSSSRGDSSAFTPWTPTPLAATLKGGKLLALQPHLIREGYVNVGMVGERERERRGDVKGE